MQNQAARPFMQIWNLDTPFWMKSSSAEKDESLEFTKMEARRRASWALLQARYSKFERFLHEDMLRYRLNGSGETGS